MKDEERTVKLNLREVQPPTLKKRPVLVVMQGPSIGQTIKLEGQLTTIGRGAQADLVLRDEIASRQHAQIVRLENESCVEYYLQDLESTNGTLLNGSPVTNQQLLEDGDRLRIGMHLIKFAMLDEFETEFQEQLHKMTQYDDLTGLRSRRSLFADLDRLVNRLALSDENTALSVLMMDVDFFKRVNDEHGHLVGSHAIRDVGHLIRDVVGGPDLAARYGGEEYMAYVAGGPEEGVALANRIRLAVEAHPFQASTTDLSRVMYLTISLGVACFRSDGATALELVQKADQALYRAKLSGRNRTCRYDPNLDRPDSVHHAVDASAIIYGPADSQ